jgi:hypothetical protein
MLTLVRLEQLENALDASVQDAHEILGMLSSNEQPSNIRLMSVADPVYRLDDTLVSRTHPLKAWAKLVHPVVLAVKSTRSRLVQPLKVLANEVIGANLTSFNLLQP